MQAILVSIKWTVVWAFVSLTGIGVLCCSLFCVCVWFFFPLWWSCCLYKWLSISIVCRPSPYKCIYEESQLLPNTQPCILCLNNPRVLLASISEEMLMLRDLARLVMHKNKMFHSSKKFSLSECSWTQYRIPFHEPPEPPVKWPKAVLQEPSPESPVTEGWQPLS